MKRLQRAAILVSLIERLKEEGSWCGETNIQKATYFLEEMMDVPLEYEFVLYKHGPYSFDLANELTALRADSILELKVPDPKYGPSYSPGKMRDYVLDRFPTTVNRFSPSIRFVASRLGDKGVSDLERLATALYVLRKDPGLSRNERARKVSEIKPHIDFANSSEAVSQVEQMMSEVNSGVHN